MAGDPVSRAIVHPPLPIITILDRVIAAVREDEGLSAALDAYDLASEYSENARVRWLSQKRGYEITLKFDADKLSPSPGVSGEPLGSAT